ncbi:MAG: peptidylprolyl isomerase [Bacteroidales bacterium]|nr:peptidylprolyl isomerase [Bacteroidales bacterium]
MKKLYFLAIFLFAAFLGNSQVSVKQQKESFKGARVEMVTNYGRIVLLLYDETPLHRDNFIKLATNRVFDGLLFHRVIEKFMIQGGDPTSKDAESGKMLGDGTLGYNIPAEFRPELFHKRGALCAAREGDMVNPKKESSASQFYIVQGRVWNTEELDNLQKRMKREIPAEQRDVYTTIGGTPFLDGEYTVFGEVIEGMEVVDKIAAVKCDKNDRPLEDVRIEKVIVIKK